MVKKKKTPKGIAKHASEGGKARAQALTPQERSDIARQAVSKRWEKEGKPALLQAEFDGPLTIGEIEFDCAVLDDGTRVISEAKFMESMGMYRSGAISTRRKKEDGKRIPLFLAHKNLKPFIEHHFGGLHYDPVRYRTKTGGVGHGIEADALPKLCEVWLDARKAGVLGPTQEHIAEKAEILIRGFAQVGIIALIDEATGYQYERQRDALQELLESILSDELRQWVKTFPNEYFKQMCRLRKVHYRGDMKLPQYFGHLTNDVVYRRLAPQVLIELQSRNPRDDSGRRSAKHHQWLSDDVGHPKLLQHLGLVVGLMKVSDDWEGFKGFLDKAAPDYSGLPLLAPLAGVGD